MSASVSTHIVGENKEDGRNSGHIQTGEGRGGSMDGQNGASLSTCSPSSSISAASAHHKTVVVPISTATATALVYSATDDAVDDSEDLPDDFVRIQKTISGERRLQQNRPKPGIQDLLPFPFSPLIRPLTVSDLESCVALENAAFANPAHRCTRDKFEYRLTACPELSMGLFCTVVPAKTQGWEIETLSTAHPVETDREDGALSVLFAHIVATRIHEAVVTNAAMDYPRDYKTARNRSGSNHGSCQPSPVGHQETGRTICIHSLAVHPKLQGVGMGQLILKAYMQQVKNSNLASRIALICQEYLVNYYKRFGFSYLSPSVAAFSGGGWHDMVFDLA